MSGISEYIGSQFAYPRGMIGRTCCIIMNVINKAMYKAIVDFADLDEKSKVLDIGYGNGYLVKKLSDSYDSFVYGIDVSKDMKFEASRRNKDAIIRGKVKLSRGNCCDMKFRSEYFDAVTSVNTVYFWGDPIEGFREVHRVLKDGGVFYNAVYSKQWMESTSYTKKGFRLYTKKQLVDFGRRAGFSKVCVKKITGDKSYVIIYKK